MKTFRILTLFVLFVLVACDDGIHCHKRPMQISDANPIQFWVSGDTIYNDQDNTGVENACYCQPIQCTDFIRLQFTDTIQDKNPSYAIRGVDSANANLFQVALSAKELYQTAAVTQFQNTNFAGGTISPWTNYAPFGGSGKNPFAWSAGPFCEATGAAGNTNAVLGQYKANKWPPGAYTVSVTAANNSSSGSSPFDQVLTMFGSDSPNTSATQLSVTSVATWPRSASQSTVVFSFVIINPIHYLLFSFAKNGPSTGFVMDLKITNISITSGPNVDYTKTVYDFYSQFSSLGVCDKQINLEILDTSANYIGTYSGSIGYSIGNVVSLNGIFYISLINSNFDNLPPDSLGVSWAITSSPIIAQSDCLDVASVQDGTKLISYTNTSDFAGLIFAEESPDVFFYFRVPAVFFQEDYPEESQHEDLSNNQSVQLYSEVKAKKLFDVGFIPYFMHKKLKLVLACDQVLIDGDYWQKQDAYTLDQGNKRYSLKKGSVWLTNANEINRNVL